MGILDKLLNKEAFEELQRNHNKLAEEFETVKAINKQLAGDFVELEAKYNVIAHDPEQYIEAEIEKRALDLEAEYAEKINHKWYAAGRKDAYAEMGIRNIEAHERGNILILLPTGEIVEQILGLEDVKPSGNGVLSDDEIIIDDLTEL